MSDPAPPDPVDTPASKPPARSGMMIAVGIYILTIFAVVCIVPFVVPMDEQRWHWVENILFFLTGLVTGVSQFYYGTSYGSRARLAKEIDAPPRAGRATDAAP